MKRCDAALKILKTSISLPPRIITYDWSKTFRKQVDASKHTARRNIDKNQKEWTRRSNHFFFEMLFQAKNCYIADGEKYLDLINFLEIPCSHLERSQF